MENSDELKIKKLEYVLDEKTKISIKIRKKVNLVYTMVILSSALIIVLCILEIIFNVTSAPREVVYSVPILATIGLISFIIDMVDFNKKREV